MITRDELEQRSRDELIDLVLQLTSLVEKQQEQIDRLEREIEALKRGQPPVAPFSRGQKKPDPKPPGRKTGQGPFTFRRAPSPSEVTEPPIAVAVNRLDCPDCGGDLVPERTDFAYVTDLPQRISPEVREYHVAVCRCERCGRAVRGEHPDLASDQWGATAHRLGPRLKAAAHTLHYALGVPVRKVPEILSLLSGVSVTQSALTQDALRHADGAVGAVYETLREQVKEAPFIHTDDTGWRVGGETAFLMAFETPTETVYQIRPRHRNEEVREIVPADYAGVLCCDRGTSYEAEALRGIAQQKCLRHIERSLEAAVEADPENPFARRLLNLLTGAHRLWQRYHAGTINRATYDRVGKVVHRRLSVLLARETVRLRCLARSRSPSSAGSTTERTRLDRRLLAGIGEWHQRGHLLRFLQDPSIEPTNNRAERAVRGAVIARKVSQCSKTERGARAYAAFLSVLRTDRQSGASALDTLCGLFAPHAFYHSLHPSSLANQ